MATADVLAELPRRNLIAESTDQEALRAHLAAGPVTFYCGFDPTAPSLHVGRLAGAAEGAALCGWGAP